MTKVYRVEDQLGYGPYEVECDVSFEMTHDAHHPLPENDAKLSSFWRDQLLKGYWHYTKYRFAFASLEQLKFWIYREDWRKELDENGFRVSVYETDSAKIGDTQAVFLKSEATLEYTLSLLEI